MSPVLLTNFNLMFEKHPVFVLSGLYLLLSSNLSSEVQTSLSYIKLGRDVR